MTISSIFAYGLAALIGIALIWVTRFSRRQDEEDLEKYRREFAENPSKRMTDDLIDLVTDHSHQTFPITPVVFWGGVLLIVYGVSMLLKAAFDTPSS